MTDLSWNYRLLPDSERERLLAFVEPFGCPAIYVLNALLGDGGSTSRRDPSALGETVGLEREDGELHGVLWFGGRGNLVVLLGDECRQALLGPSSQELVEVTCSEIRSRRTSWRIALGPMPILRRLADLESNPPLLLREQVYYAVEASQRELLRERVDHTETRSAERADLKKLVESALDLNEVDLNVPSWRVDRGWLRDSVRRRQQEQRTFVIGPIGKPICKLDLGSDGPAGSVIEGVYTLESARGQGLATRLTATVADRQLRTRPRVCLHVSATNEPARAAYERAGLRATGTTGLLLRNT